MYLYNKILLGAVAGDIIGSRFEFNSNKSIHFSFFDPKCDFTDDTVMTVAIADWLLTGSNLVDTVKYYGNKYTNRGYGNKFQLWLNTNGIKPYNSFGNGSAMRVSPVGWLFDTLEET
jgi:ADP-ribosylglycohydrolase